MNPYQVYTKEDFVPERHPVVWCVEWLLRHWRGGHWSHFTLNPLIICRCSSKTAQLQISFIAQWFQSFSKHRPSRPMLSISRKVRLSVGPCVRVSVCLFTFEVPFNGFLPPLFEVGCQIFLKIQNSWGKVMERSGLTFKHFCLEVV